MAKSSPIGLFDSGVGGLTVAHALHTLLPAEKLVYFGDTAHLPYGDKSSEAIVQYSLGIADFLLEQKCKVILIACNSASANAFDEVKAHVGKRAVVMNVIDPVVDRVCSQQKTGGGNSSGSGGPRSIGFHGNLSKAEDRKDGDLRDSSFAGGGQTIGVIGTKATIDSGTYEKKILDLDCYSGGQKKVQVNSLATPLFVPMIEEGFVFDDISNAIIRSYLSRKELEGIDSLILGCTHYPIIRNQISRFFNFDVNVLDTAQIVAQAVQLFLSENDLLSPKSSGENQFYVSDHTPYFEVIANIFFNEKISLEKRNIWK
jgi:glutamate racemase